jgi:hypothetical protein
MKKNHSCNRFVSSMIALALVGGIANAGTEESKLSPAPTVSSDEDLISGVLNLDFNSHFISYGNDVWQDGTNLSEPTFNPSLEIALKLPAEFTFTVGTWWDVNSKRGGDSSAIGGRIQEIDVWAGLAYAIGDFSIKTTYQAWNYASDTEAVIDVAFAYDCFLSPSLTVHNRIDVGAAGSGGFYTPFSPGDEGTVLVGAISYSVDAGPVTFSFPFNIAYFCSDDYHAVGADDGFGFGSISANASMPLAFIADSYGDWSIHAGLTYYVTDQDVIPNNPKGDFLTANVGLTVAF